MSSLADRFERSLALGKTLPPLTDNAAKLELYALFKQAQSGPNTAWGAPSGTRGAVWAR
jgi:acyl-CoA-binding protein